MKKPATSKAAQNQKDLNILKSAIKRKPNSKAEPKIEIQETQTSPPAVEEDTSAESIADSNQASTEEATAIDTGRTEELPIVTTEQPPIVTEDEPLQIWGQLGQKTEEDTRNATDTTAATADDNSVFKKLAEEANAEAAIETNDEAARIEGCKVKASIVVELADVIFMILCVLITWDFADENQKRFSLNPDRKKAIQHNLFKIYILDKKKAEPKKDIWFLIIGSYIPMLIVAFLMMFKRFKAKAELKKKQAEIDNLTLQHQEQTGALQNDIARLEWEKAEAIRRIRNNDLGDEGSINTPRLGKEPKQKVKAFQPQFTAPKLQTIKASPGTGKKGVQKGTKRGPYNKNK